MKRRVLTALLAAALVAVLWVPAWASGVGTPAPEAGTYDLREVPEGCTLTFLTAEGTEITPEEKQHVECADVEAFYTGAVKFRLRCAAGSTAYSRFVVQIAGASDVPTAENICYIDQASPVDNGDGTYSVEFTVYPKQMTRGTYRVYVTGNGGGWLVAGSFKYYPGYTMGDVNGDGRILADDALFALRMSVGLESAEGQEKLAADVNGDGRVLADDALAILRRSVGLETNF